MFTIRVNWNQPRFPSHHVYSCTHYTVVILEDGDLEPLRVQLVLGAGDHDIYLANGAEAFVMNAAGKTIDTIRTERKDSRTGEGSSTGPTNTSNSLSQPPSGIHSPATPVASPPERAAKTEVTERS